MNAFPTSSTSSPQVSLALPHASRLLAGVWVPDSPAITRAIEYARGQSEPSSRLDRLRLSCGDGRILVGVGDGFRTRDFRSHSPALCH